MKQYNLENGKILYDLQGKLLILSSCELAFGYRKYSKVGGWKKRTTKKGRILIELLSGDDYLVVFREGSMDRGWCKWREFETKLRHSRDDVFGFATATSNGGGCWVEFIVYPKSIQQQDGYRPKLESLSLSEDIIEEV